MENNQNPITLDEVRSIIEEQLAMLIEKSEYYRSSIDVVAMAEINQAICLSTQTLILLAGQSRSHGVADL